MNNPEHIYVFNHRTHALARTPNGWELVYKAPTDAPVRQPFTTYETARSTFWRRLACAVLVNPRRLRTAEINGTLIALVPDQDGRIHLARHGTPGTDHVRHYASPAVALSAWHDECQTVLSHAARPTR